DFSSRSSRIGFRAEAPRNTTRRPPGILLPGAPFGLPSSKEGIFPFLPKQPVSLSRVLYFPSIDRFPSFILIASPSVIGTTLTLKKPIPLEFKKFRWKLRTSAGNLNFQQNFENFRWKFKTSAGK